MKKQLLSTLKSFALKTLVIESKPTIEEIEDRRLLKIAYANWKVNQLEKILSN